MQRDWSTWLMIGAVGFGGPAGQVAILHREVVERRRWLDEDEFLAALRLCTLLPGPEAQQLATYAGWRRGGLAGGLLAGTLFVVPGALLVVALAWLHAARGSWPLIAAAFAGTRPAVVALVALAAWRIGRKSLTSPTAVVMVVGAVAALASGGPFPWVVLAAGLLGSVLLPAPVATATNDFGSDLPHTASGAIQHVAIVASVTALIWGACLWMVTVTHTAGGRGAEIARLFTTTTLLSLGGAYTVVPWALDESVARGWLDAGERFTALAMGEATPGPLILVVTFIGFMAGWKAGGESMLPAGLAGASIATLFAFLPSFALIFGFAPFVRSMHAGSRLGRAMTGVGTAVVAAILMLTLRLATDAFLPSGRVDPLAIVVALASAAGLLRGWASTPVVVLAAASIGAGASLMQGGSPG